MTCLLRCLWVALLVLGPWCAHAQPAEVVVGSYVNKIQDLNFKDNRYTLDFFLWFRWKPQGALADYKPLDSVEIINGRIDGKTSIVEKKIGDLNYASARITATMAETWELAAFPFDAHPLNVFLEDSVHPTGELVFVADTATQPARSISSPSLELAVSATKTSSPVGCTLSSRKTLSGWASKGKAASSQVSAIVAVMRAEA